MTTKKADELLLLHKQFKSQHRQQLVVVLILSPVIAVATTTYTWITWKALATTREANELQRQLLEMQNVSSASKTVSTRRSQARSVTSASTEPHRQQSRSHTNAEEPIRDRRSAIESQAPPAPAATSTQGTHAWSTRSAIDRPGRQ